MNYTAHYDRLIARARHRTLDGYRERHHVVPRCMGGGDNPENLVDLTPEEHYVAHQLLVKMYPNFRDLVVATIRMAERCSGNKAYGWLKRLNSAATSARLLGNTNRLGKPQSIETRQRISAYQRGRKKSAEHVEKVAAKLRGKTMSPKRRKEHAEFMRGNQYGKGWVPSADVRAKISAANSGKRRSPEMRAAMSQAMLARWKRIKEQGEPRL